ncbi:histidine--tRNA ligase [Rhizohabitans arisaemae]|uniref:histidine--tRNA ligase n=1 Tax=Rhizohabitans arisaemae TaxID=2720610 RepID=UPI0024B2389B|nr:histidine--tRNA ligase [Rhizohabitans arisaemae]
MSWSGQSLEPPSGTRDFLAAEHRRRESAFAVVRGVFDSYGFDPLQTPAFERLEVLTGKYGDEGDKLIFKILRRGEHEATGEADLALRYDLTVPLARVMGGYGGRLPMPYKRYAIGPVWRADRPGRGRFREFVQCDVDIVGSGALPADAEVLCAVDAALTALGVPGFRFLINSRKVLTGLLDCYEVPAEIGGRVLITLDKLDKLSPDEVVRELEERGLSAAAAKPLVEDLVAEDSVQRVRSALTGNACGQAGLAEVGRLLELVGGVVPAGRVTFTPRLVRGLDYYTGAIWEVVAPGMPGSIASGGRYDRLVASLGGPDLPAVGGSLGIERILALLPDSDGESDRLDVAVTILDEDDAPGLLALAARLRRAGLRTGVYLGSSGKLAKQLKWASDRGARHTLIQGPAEKAERRVTVRDMDTACQTTVPIGEVIAYLADRPGTGPRPGGPPVPSDEDGDDRDGQQGQ